MDPIQNLDLFLATLMSAFQSKQWSLLAVLAIVGVVAALRFGLGKYVPFFKTDLGGTLLAFVGGFVGSVATAVAGGSAITATFVPAFLMTFAAMGGWTTVKRLALPALKWLLAKLGIMTDPLGDADKAGKDAVDSKPAGGAGSPKDLG